MDLSTSTALMTVTNRGLGRAFAIDLVRRGATVYASARNPDLAPVRPIRDEINRRVGQLLAELVPTHG